MKSIMQDKKECYLCRMIDEDFVLSGQGLHKHHVVFGTANRKNSEKYGVWVWLCPAHHNMSDMGVHQNRERAEALIRDGQRKFEAIYSHEKWMEVFGKNWL